MRRYICVYADQRLLSALFPWSLSFYFETSSLSKREAYWLSHGRFLVVLEIRTQVLFMLAWQALYLLGHLPSHFLNERKHLFLHDCKMVRFCLLVFLEFCYWTTGFCCYYCLFFDTGSHYIALAGCRHTESTYFYPKC